MFSSLTSTNLDNSPLFLATVVFKNEAAIKETNTKNAAAIVELGVE